MVIKSVWYELKMLRPKAVDDPTEDLTADNTIYNVKTINSATRSDLSGVWLAVIKTLASVRG